MLTPVAAGVWAHQSELLQNNAVVVQGRAGVLLVDPGITNHELTCLANDLEQPVVAGFSTHPDWDHVLWHADFGDAPRYGTARGAAHIRDVLADPDWPARVAEATPPEIDVPLEGFGRITGLPAGTEHLPWDGPRLRIIEHPGHAEGHAALLVEESGVLIAGDMLSDVLIPMPDLGAENPLDDYLEGLDRLEALARDVDIVVPGHGSVAGAEQFRARISLDRAYVVALQDGRTPDDPRIGPAATFGHGWLPGVTEWQLKQLAAKPGSGSR